MEACSFKPDTSRPEWAFRGLTRLHRMAHDAAFARLGLKEIGQPIMLLVLSDCHREERRCTQKELGEILQLSPSTVTISIKSLERRGYLRRHADDKDKRRKFVEITEEGLAVAEACRRGLDDIDSAMYNGFTAHERAQAAALFLRIGNNLLPFIEEDTAAKEVP